MSLFKFPTDDTVTTSISQPVQAERATTRRGPHRRGPSSRDLRIVSESRGEVDAGNQFIVFQMNPQIEGPTILESSQVEPALEGSVEEPDVLVAMEMLSFHLSQSEQIDKGSRATMRINFGKDESSTDKTFDTVFWSIAAGLQLYDEHKNGKPAAKDMKADFTKAFGNRPIEVPGGLGRLSFEVVKHVEPPWWKKLLGFASSDTAGALVSVLGFPAITTRAIGVIDELLNRLDQSDPEVLFSSIPMRLALSKWAREEFTGGSARVRVGALQRGFCVFAQGKDFHKIANSDAIYYPTYGKLAPLDVPEGDIVSGNYEDPFKDVTYAVLRIGVRATKLDPTFNFGH